MPSAQSGFNLSNKAPLPSDVLSLPFSTVYNYSAFYTMACCDDLSGLAIDLIIQDPNYLSKLNRLLPKSSRHTFEGDAAFSDVLFLAHIKLPNLKQPYCVNWSRATFWKDLTPAKKLIFGRLYIIKKGKSPG
jgi:hypothetical protein